MQTQPITAAIRDGHHRLTYAVSFACTAHMAQVRKGTSVPYISHLLQVAGLVLEFGGDFDQAAAGILHDSVEDTAATLAEIREGFGDRVADLVAACTDTDEADASEIDPATSAKIKAPWKVRKTRYLEKLADVTPDAALVIACDKLHNMRTQIADLSFGGETVKFNAPLADRMWLQGAMLEALRPKLSPRMLAALAETTRELELMQDFAPAGQRDAFIAAGMETA